MDVATPTLDPGPVREPVASEPLVARWLGRIAYRDAWALQHELVEQRIAGRIPDQLLLLEHPAVLTLGRHAGDGHVRASADELAARGIELIRVERGGEVTYHGPGQLVAYPILALSRRGLLLRPLVRALEAAMAETCAAFGVSAGRRDGHPGCWCDGAGASPRKIGALGIRVERGVCYHGIALNVQPDLADFELIDPCGMPEVESTSIARELGFLRTVPGRGSGGDARQGIMLAHRDPALEHPEIPARFDAQGGITGDRSSFGAGFPVLDRPGVGLDPAIRRGLAMPGDPHDGANAPPTTTRESSDAPEGIRMGHTIGHLTHETDPAGRDAPTGISAGTLPPEPSVERAARALPPEPSVERTARTLPPEPSVERAARIFARALADQLDAELQGFGAVASGAVAPGAVPPEEA